MDEYKEMKIPVIHLYGQSAYHMDAIILGNPEGLYALQKAIDRALKMANGHYSQEVFVNDGEGYNIEVQIIRAENIDCLPVPYTADYAQDKTGRSPSSFLK